MAGNPERLTCVSIILCDDIFRDESTRKLVLVGTFNLIRARAFPCVHPRMCILFSLTGGRGDYQLSVTVEHERSGVEVLKMDGPLRVSNPLAIVDFDVRLSNLELPAGGKYWVCVRSDGEIVGQRPFDVTALEPEREVGREQGQQ
jgi:hypothetical protein